MSWEEISIDLEKRLGVPRDGWKQLKLSDMRELDPANTEDKKIILIGEEILKNIKDKQHSRYKNTFPHVFL